MKQNASKRFDRLPETVEERVVEGRPSRRQVLDFWEDNYAIPPETFEEFTFWERGAGKLWAFHADLPSPVDAEGLGIACLRARQEHWKPTTEAVQRFGKHATKNVIHLSGEEAERFVDGEDQELAWDGDWGYLIVAHDLAGGPEPIGVGLYLHGELRSQIPKGRQRDLS
jgi:NOL1/NOP2/fmu family ribosome biogenesis protein